MLRAVNTSELPLFPGDEVDNSGIVQHEEIFNVFPQYEFLGKDRQKHYLRFQEDVRGLALVREFHVDSLTSKNNSLTLFSSARVSLCLLDGVRLLFLLRFGCAG